MLNYDHCSGLVTKAMDSHHEHFPGLK